MKILHLIPSLGIGGTEKILFELCRGLNASKFENHIVSLKSGGEAQKKISEIGVPVTLLNSPDGLISGILALPFVYAKLKTVMKGVAPDLIHTWLTRANVLGRLAARGAGFQRVVSSLRVMEVEKSYHRMAERWTGDLARSITVNSSALRDFAVNAIGLPEEKICLIRNGIDTARILDQNLVNSYRHQWAASGKFTVGAIGRFHRQKGVDVLLEAAQAILKAHPGAQFLIAGDGPEKNNLASQARRLGIGSSVTFCGWVKGAPEFLSILDLFVLPSRWEGMPNAVMEAMLAEKPVIATKVSGVPDLIKNEVDGLIVAPEDAAGLSQAINRLINDLEFGQELARAARQKIMSHFDLKNMISEYEKLYESIQN